MRGTEHRWISMRGTEHRWISTVMLPVWIPPHMIPTRTAHHHAPSHLGIPHLGMVPHVAQMIPTRATHHQSAPVVQHSTSQTHRSVFLLTTAGQCHLSAPQLFSL